MKKYIPKNIEKLLKELLTFKINEERLQQKNLILTELIRNCFRKNVSEEKGSGNVQERKSSMGSLQVRRARRQGPEEKNVDLMGVSITEKSQNKANRSKRGRPKLSQN